MKKLFIFLSVVMGIAVIGGACYGLFSNTQVPDNRVSIYTWAGTFDPHIIRQFEKETGIKVHMDFYESDEILEAKLLTGKCGYDIVMPSATPFFGRQVQLKDKIFTRLDKSKLKNWDNVDKDILHLVNKLDPDNTYGIPFSWGVTGFAYDAKKIRKIFGAKGRHPSSLSFVYDVKNIKKLSQCGVSLLDYPQDLVESILYYKKIVPHYGDMSQIKLAYEVLNELRPYIKHFTSNTGRLINDLLNGEVCITQIWSGEALRAQLEAKASKKQVDIQFFIPKEYQGVWCDLMVIPQKAPHLENAYKFIDFMLRPEIAAKNSEYLLIPIANEKSLKYLPASLRNNPLFYPKEVFKNFRIHEILSLRFERELTRMWTKTKVNHK